MRLDDFHVTQAGRQIPVLGFLAMQLDLQSQVVERVGVAQGIGVGDLAVLVEIEQRLIKGLHAQFARAPHHVLDFSDLALEDQVGYQG